MADDAQESEPGGIIAERCPICGTLMTAEQAGPIRLVNPAHRMMIADTEIGEGQSVTRMHCENGHTFWAIEDEEDGDEQ
jgi:hypothetical protein